MLDELELFLNEPEFKHQTVIDQMNFIYIIELN